jgi:dodecin
VSVTKVIEVIGSSATSSDEAVREAVAAASKSIRGITHVDVVEVTCDVEQGVVTRWNALVKISFPVEPRQ